MYEQNTADLNALQNAPPLSVLVVSFVAMAMVEA